VRYFPKCRTEYRDGFDACADCQVPLVDELLPEPPKEYINYKELLNTYNHADIAFLKSLLDSHKINYYIKGEDFVRLNPANPQPATLMVDEKQHEEVKELLKDFKGRFTNLPSWGNE
jgi:hypothetical protein